MMFSPSTKCLYGTFQTISKHGQIVSVTIVRPVRTHQPHRTSPSQEIRLGVKANVASCKPVFPVYISDEQKRLWIKKRQIYVPSSMYSSIKWLLVVLREKIKPG